MKINFALDWSPNTLHAGYFTAEAEGYFKESQLDVAFITPEDDNYATTPARQLADQQVHVAVAPSESVISFNTLPNSVPLVAVAAVLQDDVSAIVARSDSDIDRPAELDGKTFASYNARFENDTVRELVRADGGQGNFTVVNPDKLDMWRTVTEGSADATWVFLPWEGPQAQYEAQVSFHAFRLGDYGIPYGYSPLLVTHRDFLEQESETLRAFLQAVAKGWRFVSEYPGRTAEMLHMHISHPNFQNLKMVRESLAQLQPAILGEARRWGLMEDSRWQEWIAWMSRTQVLKDTSGTPMRSEQINTSELYTNDLLK